MALLQGRDRRFAEAVAQLPYCNPFVPQRIALERQALGSRFVDRGGVWHFDADRLENPNHRAIEERLDELLPQLSSALADSTASEDEQRLYRDLALYSLYFRYERRFLDLIESEGRRRAAFYRDFEEDARRLLKAPGLELPEVAEPPLLFAWFFQIRRAFHYIHRSIVGASMPAARLRAAVWESVFTHDMHRFRRGLFERMGDLTTLITGPTGTGKELVAQAIGLSRFIPFDPGKEEFAQDTHEAFYALNLSALSLTLLESELFGHKRGSFTGAIADRRGWLEVCPPLGAVFLDEIGEVDESIQVKLLRVIETRTFQRLGETSDRRFFGKLIAATNRDPATEMAQGRLREDFYYRLCSDRIETPSLRAQLADSPDELPKIVLAVTAQLVGPAEAESLAQEVCGWIGRELGDDYSWPGNFRELEQCIRAVMIRGSYRPATGADADSDGLDRRLLEPMRSGELDLESVERLYVTHVYAREGSYQGAARRLGMDRRTVKAKVDREWLAALGRDSSSQ